MFTCKLIIIVFNSIPAGLSMQYLNNSGKYLLWKFCHSPEYQAVQRNFMKAVDSLQIESVMVSEL